MIKKLTIAAALMLVSACGDPDKTEIGNGTAATTALPAKPPISSDDIDQMVEDQRQSGQGNAAAPTGAAEPR